MPNSCSAQRASLTSPLLRLGAALLCSALLAAGSGAQEPDKEAPLEETAESGWDFLVAKYDANKDGRISSKEYDRSRATFDRLDSDGDGFITASDIGERRRGRPRMDRGSPPKKGDVAPGFELEALPPTPKTKAEAKIAESKARKRRKSKAGPRKVSLSSFKGKKPVALIFGSYT